MCYWTYRSTDVSMCGSTASVCNRRNTRERCPYVGAGLAYALFLAPFRTKQAPSPAATGHHPVQSHLDASRRGESVPATSRRSADGRVTVSASPVWYRTPISESPHPLSHIFLVRGRERSHGAPCGGRGGCWQEVVPRVRQLVPGARVVGCSGFGVIGMGHGHGCQTGVPEDEVPDAQPLEIEQKPALSLTLACACVRFRNSRV